MSEVKSPRRRWPWLLLALAVIAVAGVLLLREGAAVKVRIATPTQGLIEETVVASSVGTVEPEQTAAVSAEVEGRVAEIRLRHGSAAKGAPIVLLDRRDLETRREQSARDREVARLRIEQARLRVDKVDAELKRVRGTDEPAQRIEQLEKDLAIARKDVEIAEASEKTLSSALDVIELQLAKTAIAAPFDGTVTKMQVEVGESVTPGRALFTYQSRPPFLVRAPIDEVDMGRMKLGLDCKVRVDALKDRVFGGKIVEIMPAASTDQKNNRTVEVKVRVPDLPPEAVAGISAHLEVILDRKDGALRVPTALIRRDHEGKGRYVFVLENGRARRRAVRTGLWNWELTEVTEGLSTSDRVISQTAELDDSAKLKEGVRVTATNGP